MSATLGGVAAPVREAALPALARVLLSYLFLVSGWAKLTAPAATIQYITAHGLPLPGLGYAVAVAIELGGGLAVLLGWRTLPAGLVLAGWCLVTGAVFHYVPGNHDMALHLMKNVAMAGGFLQLAAFGPGRWSLDALRLRRVVLLRAV